MNYSSDQYYKSQNLYDLEVSCNQGLSDENIDTLSEQSGISGFMPVKTSDQVAYLDNKQLTARIQSMDFTNTEGSDSLNRLVLKEGRFPENPDEIVLCDDRKKNFKFDVGDTFSIAQNESDSATLKYKEFKIVGSVSSPEYVCATAQEVSSVGSGIVGQIGFCMSGAFADDYPTTQVYITLDGAKDFSYGTSAYSDFVSERKQSFEDLAPTIEDQIVDSRNAKVEEKRSELISAVRAGQMSIAQAQAVAAQAQQQVDDIARPEVYCLDRSQNFGIESRRMDSERMDKIASVFPLIFFLVAALVCLTSMTRMVDEERALIGTLKSLGYSRYRIGAKYMLYVFIACVAGGIVGIIALSSFLPWIIQNAYGIIYSIPYCIAPPDMPIFAGSILAMLAIVSLATFFSLRSALAEKPAPLLLPKVQKAGKRVLLERIRPLWNRLNFLWKINLRNTFLFKKRFIMTTIGIMGCTALLLTGFGLNDSINDIIDKHYGNVCLYNTQIKFDPDSLEGEEKNKFDDFVNNPEYFSDSNLIYDKSFKVQTEKEGNVTVILDVPQDFQNFSKAYDFRNRETKEPLNLGDDEVILNEKLANMLNVKVGDEFELYFLDSLGNIKGTSIKLKCTGICEFYIMNYVFAGKNAITQAYKDYPDEEIKYNSILTTSPTDQGIRDQITEKSKDISAIKTVSFNDEAIKNYREMLKAVTSIVVVLIVSAAALAFIVLYNLTNINITERVREIATFKVLGFHNRELRKYIFREVILLSVIGSVIGLVAGIALEKFVVLSAEVAPVMFGRSIHPLSFVISFALSILFTIIVLLFMRPKIRKVEMVESLKSYD